MTEAAWFLDDIDPETRQQAIEGAKSRGLTLEQYIEELLDPSAPRHRAAPSAHEVPEVGTQSARSLPKTTETRAPTPPAAWGAEGLALKHKLEALERRVSHAVSSLDSAVGTLDSSVFGMSARLDEHQAEAANVAADAQQALQDLSSALAALRARLAESEADLGALSEAQEEARRSLDQRGDQIDVRLDGVEQIARNAERALGKLAQAQETLRQAVTADFEDLQRDTDAKITGGMNELRAAAEAATDDVEIALAHLIHEMHDLRQAQEDRLAESAAETRNRVQVAFADASKRVEALTERVDEQERTAEQLRMQIAKVEGGAHAAIEQSAAMLSRTAEASHARAQALEARADALDERQQDLSLQLQTIDSAVVSLVGEVIDLRETADRGAAEAAAATDQARSDFEERLKAFSATLAATRADTSQLRAKTDAEIERVEACALAGLEKQARDLARVDAELELKLARAASDTDKLIEDVQARLESELVGLRDQQLSAQKRLTQLETVEHPLDRDIARRLAALENANGATPAIDSLQRRLAELTARLDAAPLAQMEVKLATAAADAGRAQQRADRIELDLADMRLAQMSTREVENLLPELAQRIEELEQRQATGLEALRAEIADFIDANDRRLTALEQGARPSEEDQTAGAFEALRRRIEDRVLGVEQRSVRALAQVAETITAIEHRLARPGSAQA